ncbi:unnamed protein product, partial [Amoebophrya sp. A120]
TPGDHEGAFGIGVAPKTAAAFSILSQLVGWAAAKTRRHHVASTTTPSVEDSVNSPEFQYAIRKGIADYTNQQISDVSLHIDQSQVENVTIVDEGSSTSSTSFLMLSAAHNSTIPDSSTSRSAGEVQRRTAAARPERSTLSNASSIVSVMQRFKSDAQETVEVTFHINTTSEEQAWAVNDVWKFVKEGTDEYGAMVGVQKDEIVAQNITGLEIIEITTTSTTTSTSTTTTTTTTTTTVDCVGSWNVTDLQAQCTGQGETVTRIFT